MLLIKLAGLPIQGNLKPLIYFLHLVCGESRDFYEVRITQIGGVYLSPLSLRVYIPFIVIVLDKSQGLKFLIINFLCFNLINNDINLKLFAIIDFNVIKIREDIVGGGQVVAQHNIDLYNFRALKIDVLLLQTFTHYAFKFVDL